MESSGVPKVGKAYGTFQEIKDLCREVAAEGGWRIKVLVRKLINKHHCIGAPPPQRLEQSRLKFLVNHLPLLGSINRKTPTGDIQALAAMHLGGPINDFMARQARRIIAGEDERSIEDNYTKIPEYLERLKVENPGVSTNLVLHRGAFQRAFMCPEESKSFLIFSLRWLGLDGTHLRNGYKNIVLIAIGRDQNNKVYPLAWAVVESENNKTWAWFVRKLKEALPGLKEGSKYTVCSNRDKGLQNAIDSLLPRHHGVYCVWHLAENVKKHYGAACSKLFFQLALAAEQAEFNRVMAKITSLRPAAAAYINAIDSRRWAIKDTPARRFGHVTSGANESFNATIRGDRELLTLRLLVSLWSRVIEMRAQRYALATAHQAELMRVPPREAWGHTQSFTPFRQKLLKRNLQEATGYKCRINAHVALNHDAHAATVQHHFNAKVHIVRLNRKECTCREFQNHEFPCRHAIVVIFAIRRRVSHYYSHIYKTHMWKNSYASILIEGQPERRLMQPVRVNNLLPGPSSQPPPKKKQAGAAQRKRKQFGDRYSDGRATIRNKCGICGETGHNARSRRKCRGYPTI